METDIAFPFLWWHKSKANRCLYPLLCYKCPHLWQEKRNNRLCHYFGRYLLRWEEYVQLELPAHTSCPGQALWRVEGPGPEHPGRFLGRIKPLKLLEYLFGFYHLQRHNPGILSTSQLSRENRGLLS